MGCVHGKHKSGSKKLQQQQQNQDPKHSEALNNRKGQGEGLYQHLHEDVGDILTSDSDGDSFTEGLRPPIVLISGRDSKGNSLAGTPKTGTPKLRSETGTPKQRIRSGLDNGTPKAKSKSGTPKWKPEGYLTPKGRADSGGGGSKSNTPYELGSNRRNSLDTPLLDSLDLDLGITRLSRISDQYLPASGSRVVKVPDGDFELRYSYLTQRGYYPEALDKANQDSFCAHTIFGENPSDHFFGVFDGHGEFGTQCSQFVKRTLCENLLRSRHFQNDPIQGYQVAYTTTNTQLHRCEIDDTMSGTTSITVLVRGRTLYVANVGDSRAVLAERRGNNALVAMDLSTDQTPFREDECARVKACGARILTLDQLEGLKNPDIQCWGGEDDDDGDPPRLWVQNGMYPGTAFTRSIGDSAAEQIGVIANPEVLVVELTSKHPFFVIASDGVFEFLNSQTVVDMVAKYKDPKEACAAIVAESYRLWLQYETRTDDITIIVVHIDNLQNVEMQPDLYRKETQGMLALPGLKSPSRTSTKDNFKSVRPARHDFSRARARAIEASLEQDEPWAPPTEPHVKTQEEEEISVKRFHGILTRKQGLWSHDDFKAQITQALQGNFLFQSLTEKQRHTLIECMELVEVNAGDIVIRQGFEGDLFYVVESGEFEVLITQNPNIVAQETGTVVQRYSAESNPCFGELALMYNKPGQGTVRAITNGTLWVLEREAFRGILLLKYMNRPSLKTLRSINIFSKLSLSHLHRLAEALTEVSFAAGDTVVHQDVKLNMFYIVHQGHIEVINHEPENNEVHSDFLPPRTSMEWAGEKISFIDHGDHQKVNPEVKSFGEWVLCDDRARSISVVAVTDVECWSITRQAFEEAVGPLRMIVMEDAKHMEQMLQLRSLQLAEVDEHVFEKISLKDLDWQETVYLTDCSEVGVVICKNSEDIVSMKRYQRRKVQRLGREGQVLLERSLFKQLRPSPFVPHLLATPIDSDSVALVLNCVLAGPLELLLRSPLDENSARFIVANVILAIELLHKDGVVYRGISPDVLMVDRKGRIQLIDFRFAKQMSNERTFTITGMADFLAPEIIQGQGHGLASDWWAVGVLVYFMLQNELPFGSWRDNELDTFGKIVGRQMALPSNLSSGAVDLIDKLLVVDPNQRLGCGSHGPTAIKEHPWFKDINWDKLLDCSIDVPMEILTRLQLALDFLPVDDSYQVFDLQPDDDAPPWLDGW